MCQAAWVLPMGGLGGSEFDLVAQKMAVKFSKEAPIFKRSFYLSEGRARVKSHLEPGRVTAQEQVVYKDKDDRSAELAAITALERECLSEASHFACLPFFSMKKRKRKRPPDLYSNQVRRATLL